MPEGAVALPTTTSATRGMILRLPSPSLVSPHPVPEYLIHLRRHTFLSPSFLSLLLLSLRFRKQAAVPCDSPPRYYAAILFTRMRSRFDQKNFPLSFAASPLFNPYSFFLNRKNYINPSASNVKFRARNLSVKSFPSTTGNYRHRDSAFSLEGVVRCARKKKSSIRERERERS